ncbi:MAG: AI-2E family transporter [Candidatus Pacebacteria bacterium]|nr:AI-2E family transporter [Candidatus Paceibacterota bacterium]MDD4074223.1 AI-2E family transporter [Candidatus Paceibacterota bacterium]
MKELTTIDISWKAILKVVIAIVIFNCLFLFKTIIGWVFLALVISILINPLIDFLRINRVFSSAIVYGLILLIISLFIYLVVPPLITEIQSFSNVFGDHFKNIPSFLSGLGLDSLESFSNLSSNLNETIIKISSNILSILTSLFGSIFAAFTVFVLAFFFSIEKTDIINGIKVIAPKKMEKEIISRWEKSQKHVVGWFGSRIISCVFIGLATFIFCLIMNIKFALIWGILAGILNIIPMIGPLATGLFLTAFVLMNSLPKAIIVLIFSIIIQQIESNILMPILTKKINGLPTSLVLISILIGGVIWGVIGAVLAIPIAGIIFEATKDYFKNRED